MMRDVWWLSTIHGIFDWEIMVRSMENPCKYQWNIIRKHTHNEEAWNVVDYEIL